MITSLYIGTETLDLFEDENIEINLSVTDIDNIESNTTEYTKDFTVPASLKNNKLFKHYYNADIDNAFDARIKVEGGILLNGFVYKLGKFRLSKVSVKKGLPSSYTIQFWGNLLSLKDSLGKDELSDLDLTEFDHNYTSAIVKTGLESSLFNTNIIYNLFAKKQYYYSTDPNDTAITDEIANIAYGNGTGDNGVLWNELRPSIRIIEIIKAIEVKYGFNLSRDFFGRPEFNNLFMWLNPNAEGLVGGDTQIIDWDSGDTNQINTTTNIGSFDVSNTAASNDDIHWDLYLYITPNSLYNNTPYTVKFYVDGEVANEITLTGYQAIPRYELYVRDAPDNPYTYNCYWEISSGQEFKYSSRIRQEWRKSNDSLGTFNTYASENTIDSKFIVSEEIPKMKIVDFLKGLFKMFKLVVIPTDYNSLYINTLVDYYAEGSLYDITKYVDFDEYDVNRGKLLNEINFLFQEPTTILNTQFEINNGKAYGDEENEIKDDNGKPLDGDKLDYTLPFEQIVYERLKDINTNSTTDIQYGAIIDEDLKPANPKPHIFYSVNSSMFNTNIGFINDLGIKENIFGSLNIPAHTYPLSLPSFSTVFSEEFNEWNGGKITNTLYKNYHKDYIDSIFNVKRRDYKFKAKLPYRIINNLELNDIFKIKQNYYRIASYNLNLLTGESELNLITSFDDQIGSFTPSRTNIYVDYKAQTESIYVTNLGNFTFNKVDKGYDVDWVSVTSNLNNVYFTFALNETDLSRDMFVDLLDETATKTIRVYLNQAGQDIVSYRFYQDKNSQYIPLL